MENFIITFLYSQVMSKQSGFVYTGVKSGYTENIPGKPYGGVISMYNRSHVRLLAAVNRDNISQSAKLIFTGWLCLH